MPADIANRARALAIERLQANGDDPDRLENEIRHYGDACADVANLRQQWEEVGSPAYCLGSQAQVVAHPMVKAIHDAERHVAALADALGILPKRSVGRPKGASQADDRKRLRAA